MPVNLSVIIKFRMMPVKHIKTKWVITINVFIEKKQQLKGQHQI